MRLVTILLAATVFGWAQKPVIAPGGVVNAASYATGRAPARDVSRDSLVAIFGSDLARAERTAEGFPLPTELAGTSVRVNGLPVPLLYVSPRQINVQFSVPGVSAVTPIENAVELVVVTTSGASDPVPVTVGEGPFGIFTLDGSGCGRGAVLNVAGDGSVTLNSPSNSASPGDFISVYGTGMVAFLNPPATGYPSPSNPPSMAMNWGLYGATFDFPATTLRSDRLASPFTDCALPCSRQTVFWAGRAPGFVGLDQVNIRIPETAREGCGVPLMINGEGGRSQPVPISIRRGGGACIDPPTAARGQVTWEKAVVSSAAGVEESETFTAEFPASPGKRPPFQVELDPGTSLVRVADFPGPSCPLPGYSNLDAGSVTIEGPEFGPVAVAPTTGDGQRVYRAALPAGTMRPGSFRVTAVGGDTGNFQSPVRTGSGIRITSSFPPGTTVPDSLNRPRPLTVNWTGGDPDAMVTVKLVRSYAFFDLYNFTQAPASRGTADLVVGGLLGPVELIVEVTPRPDQTAAISASGLSLGGQHLWKYTYRFTGLRVVEAP